MNEILELEVVNDTSDIKTDIVVSRMQEAEIYETQGLADEAINIYTELLQDCQKHNLPFLDTINQKLSQLQSKSSAGPSLQAQKAQHTSRLDNILGLIEAGFHTEALKEIEQLLTTETSKGELYCLMAECHLHLSSPFDAIDCYTEAIKDQNIPKAKKLEVLYKLSVIHEENGNVAHAIQVLEQIIALDKNYKNATARHTDLSHTAKRFGRFYYLIRNKLLTDKQIEEAKEYAKNEKKPIESILLNTFNIDKIEIGKSLSEYYKCPFIDFNELEVGTTPKCISGIKEQFLRSNLFIPIKELNDIIVIAVDNPHDYSKIDNIKKTIQAGRFELAVSLKEDIEKFIDYFYGKYHIETSDQSDLFEEIMLEDAGAITVDEEDISGVSEADSVVVQLVNKIIDDAYQKNASDIHVESLTGNRGAQIRFRVDGDCRVYQNIPFSYKKALVSRIKIISGLDIAEKRLPQDGKIKFKSRTGKTIELRVATLPTTEGNEDVVMRILAASSAMPLEKIGLLEWNLTGLKKLLAMPYGLVFVVGPTGSGKTTTLHAALGYVNKPEKKIWTAEDPVEIVQEGLRQVQVKPVIGLNFARILRAFLRADPDIIMVGETRDEETAHTVIEASLTGHLVFSTLHTNSAPETVTRLLGMGMDPFNFSDALLGVLAQRLTKRLCAKCKTPYEPSDEEIEMLQKEYGYHPNHPLEIHKDITLYKAVGCNACNKTGYKGRMGIHELLTTDDTMKGLIQTKAPVFDIVKHAMEMGMLTLKQDGIQKILRGDTDIHQVRAVCMK